MSLLAELKRRNVIRVLAAYIILSWLLLQVGDILFEALELPDWTMKLVVGLLALGFVPIVIFSWVYELTPEGIKKESQVDRSRSITHETGRKLDYITIGMIVAGLLIVLGERYLFPRTTPPGTPIAASDSAGGGGNDAPPVIADDARAAEASIAVLPFTDMSQAGDQGYFADGIAEEILNVLVRIDDLKVASRTSSFAFRGRTENIGTIAEELKVRHILEGSVRKAGNQLRITAQLIDAIDDRHLWSETFDRSMDDIFAIQDEIATSVVDALAVELGTTEQGDKRLVTAPTENLSAYDLFLKGREMFLARDRIGEAIGIMQQAVELDPGFARAWETLAALYSVAPSWGVGTEAEYGPLSDQAADTALRLDPQRHFALAIKSQYLIPGEFGRAFELLDQSIAGNPKDPTPVLWRGITWRMLGFDDRAAADFELCLDLDPGYENCRNNLVFCYLDTGQWDQARAWLDRNLTAVPVRHTVIYPHLVPHLVRSGEIALAYAIADSPSWNFRGDSRPIHWWIEGLELSGEERAERADRLIQWSRARNSEVPALVLASLGRFHDLAGDTETIRILWREDLEGLRRSPRFKHVVRETGIYDYWASHGFPPRCRDLGDGDFECD